MSDLRPAGAESPTDPSESSIPDSHLPAERGRPPIPAVSVPGSLFPVPALLHPPSWPEGSGYAHGIATEGRLVFVAGQIGWDPVTERVVEGGIAAQTRQALANIVAVLAEAGAEPAHLVRLTWFITSRAAYARERRAIGTAYREVVGRHFPPMSVVAVAALLEDGAEVEIEATAVVSVSNPPANSTGGAWRRSP